MTLKRFIIFIILFSLSCNNNTGISFEKNKLDTITKTNTKQKRKLNENNSNKLDTILRDKNVILLGDTSKHLEDAVNYIAVRFKPYIRFSDFKVDTLNDKIKSSIKYSSNPTAKHFKTYITTTYKEVGLNFGGHYCFVEWGCGSNCQESALVDLKTGIVYDGVAASLGYHFKKDSRMLIVNPVDSTGFYLNCAYCEPEIFLWNDKTKEFEPR